MDRVRIMGNLIREISGMMRNIAAAACCLLFSANALAGSADILASNNQAGVQFIATRVNYAETGNGFLGTPNELLDIETGPVPGVALSLSVMDGPENFYYHAGYDHSTGHTHYTGAFMGGTFGTVRGISSATMSNYDARLGKGFDSRGPFMLTPYLEFGGHEWNRGVNYGEIYIHSYYGLGLLGQYSPKDQMVLSVNAMLGRTFGSYIVVNSGPGLTGFSGPLGNSPLFRIGAAADYAFTKHVHGNIAVDYTGFRYGMSAPYPVGGGFVEWEPDSWSRYTTFKLGLGVAF